MKGKAMSLWELLLGLLCTDSFLEPFIKAGRAFPILEPLWTTQRDLGQPWTLRAQSPSRRQTPDAGQKVWCPGLEETAPGRGTSSKWKR